MHESGTVLAHGCLAEQRASEGDAEETRGKPADCGGAEVQRGETEYAITRKLRRFVVEARIRGEAAQKSSREDES